ncbi:MAG: hypothetical protein SVW57_08835 [Thermodesulfobacteriota bacterium]|nr:hypothetical protein [Thermodesulfobacteriota bacterium]
MDLSPSFDDPILLTPTGRRIMRNKKWIKSISIISFFSVLIAACGTHVIKPDKSDISAAEDYKIVLNAWNEGHQDEAEIG